MNALDLTKWNALIDRIAKDLHDGKLKPSDLDEEMVRRTANELAAGQTKGWGKEWTKINYNSTDWETNRKLRANLYRFSGAKTWQQLSDMHDALYDDKGKIRLFEDFKKDVLKIHQAYNLNHLDAEYSTAVKSAQHAREWRELEDNADLFPNLRYRTVGDDRVREAHAALDNIVRPVNDEFWDSYYPPNGWRCRCYVEPTDDAPQGEVGDDLDLRPEWLMNVAKDNRVFGNKHPYFIIPKADRTEVFKAFKNIIDADAFYSLLKSYKAGGRLEAHPLHNERVNVDTGRLLALKGYKVKLRPEVGDGKQPDLWIDGELGDVKRPKGIGGLASLMESANDQNAHTAVFVIGGHFTNAHDVYAKLKGSVNPKINKAVKKLILIRGNKVSEIIRDDIYADATDPLRKLVYDLFK